MDDNLISLSAVVVTKNESQHIEKCLSMLLSELSTCRNINSFEMIVVDSNSSDDTLMKAQKFKPIKTVLLSSNRYYTAAMGRRIGSEIACNEYILFLDGDIELQKGWIDQAITTMMLSNANGICGDLLDIQYDKCGKIISTRKRYNINKLRKSPNLGGNLLIDRRLLLTSGNYNPYIKNNEEAEMYSRFLKNEGIILQTPEIMGNHHTDFISTPQKILSIFKFDMKYGRSLAVKNSIKNRNFLNLVSIYIDFFRTLLICILSILFIFICLIHPLWGGTSLIIINLSNFLMYFNKGKSIHFFIDIILIIKFATGLFEKNEEFDFSYKIISS